MESPPLESPMDDEVYPCKGCGEILEEGKAFELAGNRWHLNCFRCNTCSTLLDSDANLLLLGDGSLICNNCTYSCHACHNKIEDMAILTGDQAFCATCFRCRNCKRKIENLRYARTSQGIFCMSCHESLMARRRKKSRANAAAKSKEKDSALVDKSLPALPPNAMPQSAFSPDRDTPGSIDTDTPTELSPRPRTTYPNGSSSRSSSRRAASPDRNAGDQTTRDGLTLPSTTYRNNRHSAISQASDVNGGDGDGFFIPLALDPSPAPTLTPRSTTEPTKKEVNGPDRDYFNAPKLSLRSQAAEKQSKSEANSQTSTPHIAFQERSRDSSSEYIDKPKEVLRKAPPPTSRTPSVTASPIIGNDETKRQLANSPDNPASTSAAQSSGDRFRLQEVPKNKKSSILRSDSQSDIPSPVSENGNSKAITRKEPAGLPKSESSKGLLAADKSATPRSSQESRVREDVESRPSLDSNASSIPPPRPETQNKTITRKEISSGNVKTSTAFSSGQDTSSSSASSSDTPGVTPTVNGKSISAPLIQSPINDDIAPPSRAPTRPTGPQQKLSDSYMAPRAPPAPPQAPSHKGGKASVGSFGEPISPKLPRWSSGGDFTMDEDMARILGGTDDSSQSLLRRVSNAVRHGRTGSEASNSARHGHGRSISETTRTTASPRWPKTPIAEDSVLAREISSPMSISSPIVDDPNILRRQLRNSEQRISELERQYAGSAELKSINKKLQERRKTCNMLDSQAELMVRQLEVLTDLAEKGKNSKEPMNFEEMQGMAFEQFTDKFKKLMEQMQGTLEKVVGEIDILTTEKTALVEEKISLTRDRDLLIAEFESLSSKNAQLADLNNDLTHQIQERFKAQSGNYLESPRVPMNGLGIYSNHNKSKSNMSIHGEDLGGRPSSGNTTLMGSTAGSVSTYPQSMDQDNGMDSTVLAAPHVINIRKGRANKFNWKKNSANVAKGVSKGFKGAFSSSAQERSQWATQPGDSIGMPYDSTVAPMESPGPNSMPRSASNDPARQGGGGFGLFKKSTTIPKTQSNGAIVNVAAEPPSKLFGSLLVERADFERSQIPSIVTRCIEEVQLRGMDVEGIYRRSGGAGQVKAIQDGFEKSTEYDDISDPEIDIIAVTSALKQYFRKLPIPLLTFDVYDRVLESRFIEDVEERCDHLRETFSQLHPKHRDCLEYLIFHLAQVAERSAENKMGPKNIATVFAPTIMRNRILEKEFQDVGPRNDVVEFVIEHCYDIFNNE